MTLLLERKLELPESSERSSGKVRVLDLAYETDLLHLLNQLDHFRQRLAESRKSGYLDWSVYYARMILRRVGELIERYIPTNLESMELRSAYTRRREVEEILRAILPKRQSTGLLERLGFHRHNHLMTVDSKVRFNQCLQGVSEYIRASFAVFTNRYPSSSSSRGWVEAAAIFLVDFNRMIRE